MGESPGPPSRGSWWAHQRRMNTLAKKRRESRRRSPACPPQKAASLALAPVLKWDVVPIPTRNPVPGQTRTTETETTTTASPCQWHRGGRSGGASPAGPETGRAEGRGGEGGGADGAGGAGAGEAVGGAVAEAAEAAEGAGGEEPPGEPPEPSALGGLRTSLRTSWGGASARTRSGASAGRLGLRPGTRAGGPFCTTTTRTTTALCTPRTPWTWAPPGQAGCGRWPRRPEWATWWGGITDPLDTVKTNLLVTISVAFRSRDFCQKNLLSKRGVGGGRHSLFFPVVLFPFCPYGLRIFEDFWSLHLLGHPFQCRLASPHYTFILSLDGGIWIMIMKYLFTANFSFLCIIETAPSLLKLCHEFLADHNNLHNTPILKAAIRCLQFLCCAKELDCFHLPKPNAPEFVLKYVHTWMSW